MPYNPYPKTTPGQDVVSSLNAFADSVNHVAMQQSLRQAQEQVDQANTQISDEFERSQAIKSVGQSLALKMAATGAGADQINALTKVLEPKADAQPQNILEGLASSNPRIQAVAQKYQADQYQQELDKIGAQGETKLAAANIAAAGRAEKAKKAEEASQTKVFNGQVDAFGKKKDVAELVKGRDAVDTALAQLDQAKTNPAALQSAKVGSLLASGLNRITSVELEGVKGTQGLMATAQKALANGLGNASDKDIEAIRAVLATAKESQHRQLREKAVRYASMLGNSPGTKHSTKDYYSTIHQGIFGSDESMPQFDSSGNIAADAAPSAPSASPAPAPSSGAAFGIPGFSLR